LRRHHLAGPRLGDLTGTVGVDDLRAPGAGGRDARFFQLLLLLHTGEARRHAVIIVLRPALKRVVVALGALHADAEAHLRRDLDRSRQDGTEVEVSPANELLVSTGVRRRDAQQLQLGEGVLIDVVVFGRVGPLEALARLQVSEADRLHDVEVTAQDSNFAG